MTTSKGDSTQPSSIQERCSTTESDPLFQEQLARLHEVTVTARWIVLGALWLVVLPFSVWALRSEFRLWREYLTWTAVRYGLIYHPVAAVGLVVCVSLTLSLLLWQSRNILFGLPNREQEKLKRRLLKIRQQGVSHPLWKWVIDAPKTQKGDRPLR